MKKGLKPDKKTLVYIIVSSLFFLLDVALFAVAIYSIVAQLNGALFLPSYFRALCIAAIVVNGVWVTGSLIYFLTVKR